MRFRNKTGWIAALAGGAALALVAPAVPAARAAQPGRSAQPATRSTLLINGDRLLLRARASGTLLPAPGSGPVVALGSGARAIYLPLYALPYLGRGLAPGLFSPASLSRAESGGRLRVQIAFTGRRPGLPGITITGWAAGTARGYLTVSSARVFGAALARQFRADHGHASYDTDGMFAGGVSVAPVSTKDQPAPRGRPDYPMHELTVTGTNQAGRRDTGDEVTVLNAADWHTFGDPVESTSTFYHGAAKYSVPAGTYWAIGWFSGAGKSASTLRMDVLPQFTVAGRHTQVHLDARAATSELGAVTPRPSALRGYAFQITRGGLHHTGSVVGVFGPFGTPLWVSPTTTRPPVGWLRVYVAETLSSPAHAPGVPYAYNLLFAGRAGIIPGEHWAAPQATLATATERFFQEIPGTGQVYGESVYPPLYIGTSVPLPVRMPGAQIQYMSARPDVIYRVSYYQLSNGYGGENGPWLAVRPGQRFTQDWNADPLHPQPTVQLLSGSLARFQPEAPTAFRTGNKLSLIPNPFSDNEPGHLGYGYSDFPKSGVKVSGSYAVYQNGVLIAHGNPANQNYAGGLPPVTLSPKAATIRFVLNATRRGARFPLSPVSQTAWTWHSAPEPGATLPAGWLCGSASRHCAAQPMMTLNYQVHGLGLNEATAPGRQVIGLTVGHIESVRATVRTTGASVRISFDGGHTWHQATVTPAGPGQFTVSFTAPAGADVTLRTSATDAAGGSVTETIQDAYRT